MTGLGIFSCAVTFFMLGWIFGRKTRVDIDKEVTKAEYHFKEWYIKGYCDAFDNEKKKQELYYENFPKMGIN